MLPRIAYYTALAIKNSTLTPHELQELRDRKVRRLARYCYDYVPYYRSMFRRVGLTADDVRGTADLRLIPVTTRSDIIENYPDRIAVRGAKVGSVQSTSGTTTGTPLKIGLGARLCDIRVAQSVRRASRMGVRPWEKVATVETRGSASEGSGVRRKKGRAGIASQIFVGSFHIAVPTVHQLTLGLGRTNTDDVCRALVRYEPDILYSRPSHARRLGRTLRERGTAISPKLVMCNGEFLSDAVRNDLKDYFGADVYNSYGARELGSVGTECYLHDGLHVNADNYIHEVERDGQAVGAGELGSVLLTGLENEVTPLMRYEIGDVGIQGETERCGCGSNFPRLQTVLGRSGDGLLAADGRMIPPGVICDELESVLGLRDFQVIQRGAGVIVVRVRDLNNNSETKRKLGESLGRLLAAPQELEVETWGDADIPAKYRPVMSQLSPR